MRVTFTPRPSHLHARVLNDFGLRVPTLPRPHAHASYVIRVPRTGALPSASFRPHLAVGTLAVWLEVPVIKASRGLAPPSHFPVRFRSPVASACHGASRHAWRTLGQRDPQRSRPARSPCRARRRMPPLWARGDGRPTRAPHRVQLPPHMRGRWTAFLAFVLLWLTTAATASASSLSESRVGAFQESMGVHVGGDRDVTPEQHYENRQAYDEIASESLLATKAAPKSGGAAARLRFEPSPKHGRTARGRASAGPVNGQHALDTSLPIGKNTTRRVGVDYDGGTFAVFDETSSGVFHGHQRGWSDLTQAMKNTLVDAGMATRKGRILMD